jgi:hypothetical protein
MRFQIGGDIAESGGNLGEGDGEFHRGWIIAEPGADCENTELVFCYF